MTFDDLKTGGPYEMSVIGNETITVKNILVGEVWVCSGQSNMQWRVGASADAKNEIANANYPSIRLFQVPLAGKVTPQKDVKGSWKVYSPQSIPNFSAVGYYFGRKLFNELKSPIGLIQSAYGGASAEAWTPKEVFEKSPYAQSTLAKQKKLQEQLKERIAKWEKTKKGRKPRPGKGLREQHIPANCYNAMLNPIIPYGIRGVIWYQGEYNTDTPSEYFYTFSTLIKSWRNKWNQGEFPFYFVQLANFKARATQPVESNWAELRDAQTQTLSLPNTGMATAVDIGVANNIHPKNKQDVGRRLAYNALAKTYGKDTPFSGPMIKNAKRKGNKVTVSFKHLFGGLIQKGDALKGFAIAGSDKKYVWAEAKIVGDTVVIWNDSIKKPAYISYAWADNPETTLYNKSGLPAIPFRIEVK